MKKLGKKRRFNLNTFEYYRCNCYCTCSCDCWDACDSTCSISPPYPYEDGRNSEATYDSNDVDNENYYDDLDKPIE